jgi:UPF0755 protein
MIKKFFIFTFLVLPLFALIALSSYVYFELNKTYQGPQVNFVINNGETFGRINQRLYSEGIISNRRIFHYYSKYLNTLGKFKAGEFTIKSGSNIKEIIYTLVYGQPNLIPITIPEGKNIFEIAKLFDQAGILKEEEFLKSVKDPDLISKLNPGAKNLEGYLFPETYKFAMNSSSKQVIHAMLEVFNKKTTSIDWNHPFLSKHEVIILASIVEKETGAKIERPAIAGVFTNRLKKKMRLESDPTTIYGIWSRYKGNIKKTDLLEKTPYNTYKIPGLPAGPISNPSLEAIQAVLKPETHNYLFFVSRNDGTHIFTENYKSHLQAVENFQKKASSRQGRSWRNLKQ